MAEIKDEIQLLSEVRRFLRNVRPDIDTSPNSVVSNLVLFPASISGKLIFSQLDIVQELQVISTLTGEDLDEEAGNYALTRKSGRRSRGSAVFFTSTAPTADLEIPAGTLVSTVTFNLTQQVTYRTVATRTMPGGIGATPFFHSDTQRYETDPVPIEAVEIGTKGNIGEARISSVQGAVAGIEGVYNPDAVTGGTDRESDQVLRERVLRRARGRERNIRRGLESYLVNNFDFFDARVLRTDDTQSERANGIDAFVIDDSLAEITQTFIHDPTLDVYGLGAQVERSRVAKPMLAVLIVRGEAAGTLSEGTHYEVERDSTSILRFSMRALERLRILPAGHVALSEGEVFTVTYSFASEVSRAQIDIDTPENQILTANPLVKRGIRFGVEMRAAVTFFGGVDIEVESEKIRLALSLFFDLFRLGDPIQVSDVIVVIQTGVSGVRVQSVDQVIIREITATDEFGNIRRITDDPAGEMIEFSEKEYARFESIAISTVS